MPRLTIVLAFALWGCGSASPTTPTPPASELATAPTTVLVAGKSLTLQTSLWRDFMPISPPDGKPLGVVLRVRTEDASEVPSAVRADMVWVLNGGESWSSVPREERTRSETSPLYELVARDGPKWGPGITVDVVVRLRDGSGRAFLLRAPKQDILGTF
jgi:hypothetical protein